MDEKLFCFDIVLVIFTYSSKICEVLVCKVLVRCLTNVTLISVSKCWLFKIMVGVLLEFIEVNILNIFAQG